MQDFDTPEALDERNPYSATSRSHWEGSRTLEKALNLKNCSTDPKDGVGGMAKPLNSSIINVCLSMLREGYRQLAAQLLFASLSAGEDICEQFLNQRFDNSKCQTFSLRVSTLSASSCYEPTQQTVRLAPPPLQTAGRPG